MNRDDIIRMAREAGFTDASFCRWSAYTDNLHRFFNLAVAAEREECVQICEVIRGKDMQPAWDTAAAHCAAAIRSRGEK